MDSIATTTTSRMAKKTTDVDDEFDVVVSKYAISSCRLAHTQKKTTNKILSQQQQQQIKNGILIVPWQNKNENPISQTICHTFSSPTKKKTTHSRHSNHYEYNEKNAGYFFEKGNFFCSLRIRKWNVLHLRDLVGIHTILLQK